MRRKPYKCKQQTIELLSSCLVKVLLKLVIPLQSYAQVIFLSPRCHYLNGECGNGIYHFF